MLQRAASNAYSWWWASHIRTKQSKWLEQSLQDMGEQVASVLKLIEEDGDSFAKRAEMYYKKRPELINFVEESYRAYRALAERYDHISKELQNANSTLASAFPDQFQFAMEDDEEYGSPTMPRRPPAAASPNIPKVPKFPKKNIKAIMALTNTKKKATPTPASKSATNAPAVPKSGLTKSEALEEIDRLQKDILTKQTEKEFTKSSYESGLAKYWQIEEEITQKQDKVLQLQDEFGIGKVIEDDEARTLMAEAALKSCQETLLQLQEKQEDATALARAERQRIKDARDKLSSLKGEFLGEETKQKDQSEPNGSEDHSFQADDNWVSFEKGVGSLGEQTKELEKLRDKIKEHFDIRGNTSLTVIAMAEKIDELVNKVINLETAVSSQTALIQRLRSETDDLQTQIQSLEGDKADLIDGKIALSNKLVEMENKLQELQDLDKSVENRNSSITTHFTEAKSNLNHISETLHSAKPDEETEESQGGFLMQVTLQESRKDDGRDKGHDASISIPSEEVAKGDKKAALEMDKKDQKPAEMVKTDPEPVQKTEKLPSPKKHEQNPHSKIEENSSNKDNEPTISNVEPILKQEEQITPHTIQPEGNTSNKDKPSAPHDTQPHVNASQQAAESDRVSDISETEQARQQEEDEPNWQQMFKNGLEGKEKVLLAEYTSVLRNYKEVKKRLNEVEKKSQDNVSELAAQLKELKGANAMKDEEIQSLRQKMGILQKRLEEYKNMKEFKGVELDARNAPPEKDDEVIKLIMMDRSRELSPAEEKLRAHIDEILEENLDFWLRFSTSFHQIQKFQTSIQDLQKELAKIEDNEKKKKEGNSSSHQRDLTLKSDARAIYKHLGEIQTELTVWSEQSVQLKEELQRRFSQLCHIQEEITRALNDGAEADDMKFTSFQAAKFQGEVLNMQQENNKVADELQAGIDHVTSLQLEVERTLTRMNEELGFSASRSESDGRMRHSGSGNRVPLRSFIFGVKPKKQKQSIFSCVHPALHRKYQQLRTGDSL